MIPSRLARKGNPQEMFGNQEPVRARLANVHPGEVLHEEFLRPLGIRPGWFARAVGMSAGDTQDIVRGARDITLDTARILANYFDTSVVFWLNLQAAYDVEEEEAKRSREVGKA